MTVRFGNFYQVPEFSKDHMVITHDYRGTGNSGKPSIEYTTRMFCDDAMATSTHPQRSRSGNCPRSLHGRTDRAACRVGVSRAGQKNSFLRRPEHRFPARRGLPLAMCKEMIEWGYEEYVKKHTIQVGFTDEFAKEHPYR